MSKFWLNSSSSTILMLENSEGSGAYVISTIISRAGSFKIGVAEIECEETVKLLGVEIDFHLKFDIHISAFCKKASEQINVLKRSGQYLNFESRNAIYHACIMSFFNCRPLIWHFCSKSNIEKIGKVLKLQSHEICISRF